MVKAFSNLGRAVMDFFYSINRFVFCKMIGGSFHDWRPTKPELFYLTGHNFICRRCGKKARELHEAMMP